MVKLTAELIQSCGQRINSVGDRELDVRGYKIPVIENLGATLNQFDTIDFSDNDIRKLDNFPLLSRLQGLFMSNNRVIRIGNTLHESIANLETLILSNNMIEDLAQIDNLVQLKELKHLSLLFNPISTTEHYRSYVIFRLPQLKVLDFRKIKLKEREDAKLFFKSKEGKVVRKEIAASYRGSSVDADIADLQLDDVDDEEKQKMLGKSIIKLPGGGRESSEETANAIREAIRNASSLQEIERLQQLLRTGQIPHSHPNSTDADGGGKSHAEQDDSMEF